MIQYNDLENIFERNSDDLSVEFDNDENRLEADDDSINYL